MKTALQLIIINSFIICLGNDLKITKKYKEDIVCVKLNNNYDLILFDVNINFVSTQ